jgi:hypothetical protein
MASDLAGSEVAAVGEEFDGEITVSSRVIDQLSSGLYKDPADCLKELVNNSFDADATTVRMLVKPDANTVIIEDDGRGLTRATFERHFKRIAESHKRDDDDFTSRGRPKIGKIGIGFIAANEICERMEIESSVEGSVERLSVEIDFALMREDLASRKRESSDLAKADYSGAVYHDEDPGAHYTRVFLRDVRGEARDVLSGAQENQGDRSLYGLSPTSVQSRLMNPDLRTWDEFDSYSRASLQIALNVPVQYHEEWAPKQVRSKLKSFADSVRELDFDVILDGTSLRKPVVLTDGGHQTLLHRFKLDGASVGGEGYFFARGGRIKPTELNGLLVRIRNAAVGDYDDSFLDWPGFRSALFQDWISGEFWADDRLEDALNIDRRTLRGTHPAYVEMRSLVHAEFQKFLARVRRELYGQRSNAKKQERAEKTIETLDRLAVELRPVIGSGPAKELSSHWRPAASSGKADPPTLPPAVSKQLTRSYDVPFVIRTVSEAAAHAGLSPEQTTKLLSYITERLLG